MLTNGTAPPSQLRHREPVPTAWREDVLTRAKELDSPRAWLLETAIADLLVVELIGLTSPPWPPPPPRAASAAPSRTASPSPWATLKLPMGAVTVSLGPLLMRGQFVPA